MGKIIMSWSKCGIEIGDTGANDAMAATLTSVGEVKDKSASIESSEGDSLEMKSTGGETVAKETQEGGQTLKFRVIEPADALYTRLGIGSVDSDEYSVETHVVDKEMSVKVTPKNVGAKGIKAPKCSVSVQPGWSEEDGHYIDFTMEILHGAQVDGQSKPYWYKKFVGNGVVKDTTNGGYTEKPAS